MTLTSPFIIIFGSLGSLGLLAGGIGYLISQFKTGTRQANNDIVSSSNEIITFYKTENDNLKIIMTEKDKSNDEKFRQLTAEIGELRGQLNSEKANNERLEKIFQNRDPDTQKFQESMIQFVNDQSAVHVKIVQVLSEIHSLAIDEHNRDFKLTTTIEK